jgi:hypothetical protein
MRGDCLALIVCAITGDLKGHTFLGVFRSLSAVFISSLKVKMRDARYCSFCVLRLSSVACLKLVVSALVVRLVFKSARND